MKRHYFFGTLKSNAKLEFGPRLRHLNYHLGLREECELRLGESAGLKAQGRLGQYAG